MNIPKRKTIFSVNVIVQLWRIYTTIGILHLAEGIKAIPLTQVQAVERGTANLPCDISIPDSSEPSMRDDDVILVLWYREDLGRPIYSVDARDRSFQEAEKWQDENVFNNRAYFRSSSRPAILAIENVGVGDRGVYRCRVDFRIAQTRNEKVNLTVIVPPKEPMIVDESGAERNLFVGPYTEGSSLTLHCHVQGGIPPPRVVWYRNGKLIDSSDYEFDGIMKNDLNIAILARSDLHAELTCEASNNNISRPLATTVHLDMNFSPLEVTILEKSSRVTAGKKYDLMCQSVGSRPPAHITWRLDEKRLEGAKETTSKDGNQTTSTLSLIPNKQDTGKYLSCRAENSVIPSKALEDGWNLVIQYQPEARLKLGSSLSGDNIREGTDVYFDCVIEANPPVKSVDWRHDGKLLMHNISAGIIMTNQSLVLQGISRTAAGAYQCIGKNSLGDGISQAFHLDVLYAPACRPNQVRVHGVAKSETANITCDVDANPPKVQFRWSFNNSAESIDVPSARYRNSGTRSSVTYTPHTELDYGTLLCWAKSSIGDQRVPCVYHIIAAGRPDSVHNCSIANHSTDSFYLYCNEGFNGGLPQYFILELYEVHTNKLRVNMTTSISAFHVTGLEPGLSFHANVYAFNHKGKSEIAVIPVFTMRLPEKILTREKAKPLNVPFELNKTVSILIGVGAALVIVTIALVVLRFHCSRKRRSRDRRRREKASTTPLKMDPPDGCDSDEKNPDVIPQDSDEVEYYRKRQQHISTINTSPARVQGVTPGGYCTLRNVGNGGIPLQDLTIGPRPHYLGQEGYGTNYAGCPTLPRHHPSSSTHHMMGGEPSLNSHPHPTHSMEWPSYQGAVGVPRRPPQQQHVMHQTPPPHSSSTLVPTATRFTSFRPGCSGSPQSMVTYEHLPPPPPLLQMPIMEEHETATDAPLMSDKIESTV